VHLVWKRGKNLLYIGSVHGGELPEFMVSLVTTLAWMLSVRSLSLPLIYVAMINKLISLTIKTPTTRAVPRLAACCRTSLGPNTPSAARRSYYSVTIPARSTPPSPTLTVPMLSPSSTRFKRLWESEAVLYWSFRLYRNQCSSPCFVLSSSPTTIGFANCHVE